MSEMRIGQNQVIKEGKGISLKSDYGSKKIKYEKLMKGLSKSDIANSPTAYQKELEMLEEMHKSAQQEKLESELAWIEDRHSELQKKLESESKDMLSGGYYTYFLHDNPSARTSEVQEERDSVPKNLLDGYKVYTGISENELDDTTKEVISCFDETTADSYHLDYLLSKCKNDDNTYNPEMIDVVKRLAAKGVKASVISQILEKFDATPLGEKVYHIDKDAVRNIEIFKSKDFDDISASVCAKFLQDNFEDKELVRNQIITLKNINLSTDTVLNILDSLKVQDVNTGLIKIDNSSVKSVIDIKRALASTRKNEKEERESSLYNLGRKTFIFGDNMLVTKNGKSLYSSTISKNSVIEMQKEYQKALNDQEEEILIDFVNQYKEKDGSIAPLNVRKFATLRRLGIVYSQIMNIMHLCSANNDEVSFDTIKSIGKLKESGALSEDIPVLISSCQEDTGYCNNDDLHNACILTASVIDGETVSALLPVVRENDKLLSFFTDISSSFDQKENLIDVYNILQEKVDNLNENLLENTSQNIQTMSSSNIAGKDIVSILESLDVNTEGVFDDEDIQNACALKQFGISGKLIPALLPQVKSNDIAKDFVADMASVFTKDEDIIDMFNIIKDNNGQCSENAIEVVMKLLENMKSSYQKFYPAKFKHDSINLINYIKKVDNKSYVSDEAASICSILCYNHATIDQIRKVIGASQTFHIEQDQEEMNEAMQSHVKMNYAETLKHLQNVNKSKKEVWQIDPQLAELAWQLALRQVSPNDIAEVLDNCCKNNAELKQSKVEKVFNMLEKGVPIKKIKDSIMPAITTAPKT